MHPVGYSGGVPKLDSNHSTVSRTSKFPLHVGCFLERFRHHSPLMLTLIKGDYSDVACPQLKTLVDTTEVALCVVASNILRLRHLRGLIDGVDDCMCRPTKYPNGSTIDFVVCGLSGYRKASYDYIYVDNANSIIQKVFVQWYSTLLPTISTTSTQIWIAEGPTYFDELWVAHPNNRLNDT